MSLHCLKSDYTVLIKLNNIFMRLSYPIRIVATCIYTMKTNWNASEKINVDRTYN